jgi:hypothetical protein
MQPISLETKFKNKLIPFPRKTELWHVQESPSQQEDETQWKTSRLMLPSGQVLSHSYPSEITTF